MARIRVRSGRGSGGGRERIGSGLRRVGSGAGGWYFHEHTRDEIRKAGELSIAYQVIGDGDVDVIWSPMALNIEQYWDQPAAAYFLRRIASFSRLIFFDKRGTGLSDAVPATRRSRSVWTT